MHEAGEMALALGSTPTFTQVTEYQMQQSAQRIAAAGAASTTDPIGRNQVINMAKDMKLNPDQKDFQKGYKVMEAKATEIQDIKKSGQSWSPDYAGTTKTGGGPNLDF